MTTETTPTACCRPGHDPLDSVLYQTDEGQSDLIAALLCPENPTIPGITAPQLRAALVQASLMEDPGPYETTTATETCTICGTAQEVQIETGPCPIHTGQQITMRRWTRHEYLATGTVCGPLTEVIAG